MKNDTFSTFNTFKFGKNNKDLVFRILRYIGTENTEHSVGLCNGVCWGELYDFFKTQPPFELDPIYPVDAAIQKSQKKSVSGSYYSRWHTNPKKATGRLRIWWAYNLAVAISNIPEQRN